MSPTGEWVNDKQRYTCPKNDQHESLKQLALGDRQRGGAGSMSAMVQDAIDDYIAKVRTA